MASLRAEKISGGGCPVGFVLAEAPAHASTDELLQLVADKDGRDVFRRTETGGAARCFGTTILGVPHQQNRDKQGSTMQVAKVETHLSTFGDSDSKKWLCVRLLVRGSNQDGRSILAI